MMCNMCICNTPMELYLDCRFRLPLVVPDAAGSSGADFADIVRAGTALAYAFRISHALADNALVL